MTTSEQNRNVMPSIPAHYEGMLSSKSTSKSTPDDWCHLISQNHIMPALFDHDLGSNSGTEISIYTLVVQVETDDMKDFKWTSTKYTLSIATKVMIKQSWHYMTLGNKMAPIIRG